MVKIRQHLVSASVASRVTTKGANTRRYIVVHETSNESIGANASAHARLQSNGNSRVASWQWQVDSAEAIQSFSDNSICWHAGTAFYNQNGIGVELCVNSDGDFNKTLQNGVRLIRHLMKKHSIPLSRVVTHQTSSGKLCPRFLLTGSKGVTWNQFKSMISSSSGIVAPSTPSYFKFGDVNESLKMYQNLLDKAGYSLVVDGSFGNATLEAVKKFQSDNGLVVDGYLGQATQKKLNEIVNDKSKGELTMGQYNELKKEIERLREQLGSDRGVSPSFSKDWEWAKGKSYLDGSRPSHSVTREQLSAILHRYSKDNDLTPTAEKDLTRLLKQAYENQTLLEDHSGEVGSMSEHQIINLLISIISRKMREEDN